MKAIRGFLVCSLLASCAGAKQIAVSGPLTDQRVIDLTRAGLTADELGRMIATASQVSFDLSAAATDKLLKAGVSENTIKKMAAREAGTVAPNGQENRASGTTGDTAVVGPWLAVRHTSAMDDTETNGITSEASRTEGHFVEKPALIVSCSSKRLASAVILHGEILRMEPSNQFLHQPYTRLRIRRDKDKAYTEVAFVRGNLLLIGFGKKGLSGTTTLTVEVPFASGDTGIAVFPVTQFDEAFKPIAAACR